MVLSSLQPPRALQWNNLLFLGYFDFCKIKLFGELLFHSDANTEDSWIYTIEFILVVSAITHSHFHTHRHIDTWYVCWQSTEALAIYLNSKMNWLVQSTIFFFLYWNINSCMLIQVETAYKSATHTQHTNQSNSMWLFAPFKLFSIFISTKYSNFPFYSFCFADANGILSNMASGSITRMAKSIHSTNTTEYSGHHIVEFDRFPTTGECFSLHFVRNSACISHFGLDFMFRSTYAFDSEMKWHRARKLQYYWSWSVVRQK